MWFIWGYIVRNRELELSLERRILWLLVGCRDLIMFCFKRVFVIIDIF